MSIVTSVGFSTLESTVYAEAIQRLKPDIVLGMADVVEQKPGVKRVEKMGDRTQSWLNDAIAAIEDIDEGSSGPALFAPILPIEAEQQSYYLGALEEDLSENISGLVLYDTSSVLSIPEKLACLPRVLASKIQSPHQLLDAVAVGIDLFAIPFIGVATDAGIALDFSFLYPSFESSGQLLPLGIDMWCNSLATDVAPLRHGCDCYTCTNHHRAYLQHLLNAKEMLGWTLLQLHNYRVMEDFFAGVRQSVRDGSFDEYRKAFGRSYKLELPEKTGQGPRIRGYQYKSAGTGESRINPLAYRSLDDGVEKLAEASVPSPSIDAQDLEKHGFAEKVA